MKSPNELADGSVIESHGHTHRFYHVHAVDTKTDKDYDYFEIVREDDNEWMGRVSQYTRMDRVRALIDRRYEPEESRIQPFEFGGVLRLGRKSSGFPDVWFITIPDAYVKKFRIRVDDEIIVHIGDTSPNMALDELYHVSMQSGSCIIVLSKIRKKAGEEPAPDFDFKPGEFRTVRIEPSPSKDRRWDLFYFYDRIRSASRKDPDRWILTSDTWDTERCEPLPDDGPRVIFNDF